MARGWASWQCLFFRVLVGVETGPPFLLLSQLGCVGRCRMALFAGDVCDLHYLNVIVCCAETFEAIGQWCLQFMCPMNLPSRSMFRCLPLL